VSPESSFFLFSFQQDGSWYNRPWAPLRTLPTIRKWGNVAKTVLLYCCSSFRDHTQDRPCRILLEHYSLPAAFARGSAFSWRLISFPASFAELNVAAPLSRSQDWKPLPPPAAFTNTDFLSLIVLCRCPRFAFLSRLSRILPYVGRKHGEEALGSFFCWILWIYLVVGFFFFGRRE